MGLFMLTSELYVLCDIKITAEIETTSQTSCILMILSFYHGYTATTELFHSGFQHFAQDEMRRG